MINVGLLFDSVSDNSGDKAIGIALEKYCQRENFPYEIIDPFNYNHKRYSTVIVGGGFLIREPGDPFYDNFRVKGEHIMNSMGIAAKTGLEYLNDYTYVTVRSSYEQDILESSNVKNVAVVPCITTIMTGEDIDGVTPNFSERSIGIHIVADTIANCPDILEVIYALPQDKVFIPFTHYNKDRSLMSTLPSIEEHTLLDNLNPKQLYTVIGRMELVITSSLHMSIFAYLQNVPFLTFYQQKTYDYFKDRGLEDNIFRTTEELEEKLKRVLGGSKKTNFSAMIDKDKREIEKHLSRVSEIVRRDGEKFTLPEGPSPTADKSLKKDLLTIDQLNHVIISRDVLIKKLYRVIYGLNLDDE